MFECVGGGHAGQSFAAKDEEEGGFVLLGVIVCLARRCEDSFSFFIKRDMTRPMQYSFVYRDEIDGIRAVAVLSVILFHSGFSFCSGGYVGVDMFFVVSGYLITSLLIVDQCNSRYSLCSFYERRARRILPALFFILLCSLPFAVRWMSSEELQNFARALISTTLGLSNIFFWFNEDYFSPSTEFNPLIHTWTLSLEEQFYFLFSLLFLFFSVRDEHRCRSLFHFLLFICVFSLSLSQWSGNLRLSPPFVSSTLFWFSQHSWSSFYLLPGRIWEFTLGALLAIHQHRHRDEEKRSSLFKEGASLVGLLLLVGSLIFFDRHTPWPSLWTLVPTLGTSLLLFCADRETWIGRCLSWKYLRWLGLSSYSSYLCHQPLLAFSKITSTQEILSLPHRCSLVFLSLLLGGLSCKWVEAPWRDKQRFSRRQILVFSLLGIVFLNFLSLGLLLHSTGRNNSLSLPPSQGVDARSSINAYLDEVQWRRAADYVTARFDSLIQFRRFNLTREEKNKKKLLLIGDSHGKDLLNMIGENGKFLDYQIRFHFVSGRCQIYLGDEQRSRLIKPFDQAFCDKGHDVKDAFPLLRQADLIILAQFWKLWSAERLNETIKRLNLSKKQRILVLGIKTFSKANPNLYLDQSRSHRLSLRSTIIPTFLERNEALRKSVSPTNFIDLLEIVCEKKNNSCPIFTPQERMISFDGSHLTQSGAKFIGRLVFRSAPLNKFSLNN